MAVSKRMWISQSDCQTCKEISDIRIPEAQGQPCGNNFERELIETRNPLLQIPFQFYPTSNRISDHATYSIIHVPCFLTHKSEEKSINELPQVVSLCFISTAVLELRLRLFDLLTLH